jgi:tetratricopeptide (TPR) repeat protein
MTTRRLFALSLLLVLNAALVADAQARRPDPEALAEEGWAAVKEKRFGTALEAFIEGAKALPREPTLAYGAGLSAYMLGRNADAAEWLQRAVTLDPRFVDAAILLGNLQYRQGRMAEAIATYEKALKHSPGTPELQEALDAWRKEGQLQDRFKKSRNAHFSVLFEGPADEMFALRVVDMLEKAYARIGGTLSAYPADRITVVLYTREQFRDTTRSPDWAAAAYDGRIHVATKGALDDLAELENLLIHEYTHALVARLGGRIVPVWLNEGLATVMEADGPAYARSVLARISTRLPLSQLHGSFSVLPGQAVPLAYAQSTRAVQRIIELRGAAALSALLKDIGQGVRFEIAFRNRVAMEYKDFETMMARD